MSDNAELRPCPFCNSKNVDVQFYNDIEQYQVNCFACDARGSAHDVKARAIEKWNKRHEEGKGK